MRRSWLVGTAWCLAALAVVLEVADTLMTAAYRPLFSEETIAVHGWPFNTLAVVGAAVMGALIVSRFPRHPVGWLLSLVGAGAATSITLEAYSIWVVDHGGPGSQDAGELAGWLSLFVGGPYALTLLTIMFLIAPDGALLSPAWRGAAAVALLGLGSFWSGLLLLPGLSAGDMVLDEGETGGAAVTVLFTVGLWLITVGLTASVVSAVVRMRRATGVLHQQLLWIVASGVFLPAGVIWRQVVQGSNGGEQTWLATLPLLVAYLFIPICTAVAILHHRLYDIELIINREVLLGLGTAFVATGYVALVVLLGGALGSQTSGFWPSLPATVVVALAFQPLRSWLSRLADRAAYGRRAAPYDALSDFSQRLGGAGTEQALMPTVAQAAAQIVSARQATATLVIQGAEAMAATWPPTASRHQTAFEVPVRDAGETLGTIGVVMPADRGLREDERALLRDLADHASVAFRNAALDAEVTESLVALGLRSDELVASRRRILEARDAECRRLESVISREVFPRLDRLAPAMKRLRSAAEADLPLESVDELAADVTDALSALRELSHGIFPTQLQRSGLGAALASYLPRREGAVSLQLDSSTEGRRFGTRVEAAAYYCCAEVVPHCTAPARVVVALDGADLVVSITGVLADEVRLQEVSDRVEALAGSLQLIAGSTGEVLTVRLPTQHDRRLQQT